MNILFIHQSFPGQFKFLAPALVSSGHNVFALSLRKTVERTWKGVRMFSYNIKGKNATETHPWLIDFESKIIRGEACLRAALELKKSGFTPDIIIAHPGWGENLFVREVWPNSKLGIYCEFFY